MQQNFASFLQELGSSNSSERLSKELLEREVIRVMCKEGFSQQQIYDMPLEKLVDIFYDTYLWNAEKILSKSQSTMFV